MSSTRTYLGDSVYAEWEQGLLKLTTNNGAGNSNTIYLEPEVLQEFARFITENMRQVESLKVENMRLQIRTIANECNCRAEHGAEGAEHLLEIEKRLRKLL